MYSLPIQWLALLAVNNDTIPHTRDHWAGSVKRPTEEDIDRVMPWQRPACGHPWQVRTALEANDDVIKAGTEYEIPDSFVSSEADKPGVHRQRQWLMDLLGTEDVSLYRL